MLSIVSGNVHTHMAVFLTKSSNPTRGTTKNPCKTRDFEGAPHIKRI
jgi:hypothetical protein